MPRKKKNSTINVYMYPSLAELKGESGINTIIRKYHAIFPKHGLNIVDDISDADIQIVHAGMKEFDPSVPAIAMLHGMYWTGDYKASPAEWFSNKRIVDNLRMADAITVPSRWVAEVLQRDMRLTPYVLPHGVEYDEWRNDEEPNDAVLAYGKNRAYFDVCDPSFVTNLAKMFPNITFYTTFRPTGNDVPPNVYVTGVLDKEDFAILLRKCKVVMSPIKETFGIMTLEAMATGRPILAAAHGGNIDLVGHKINGYLYTPNDLQSMANGLQYCMDNYKTLGKSAQVSARGYNWDEPILQLRQIIEKVIAERQNPTTVGVVVPFYKKTEAQVRRTLESIKGQSVPVAKVVVVNDGDKPEFDLEGIVKEFGYEYIYQDNAGVAEARNTGVRALDTTYVGCLDADDAYGSKFVELCKAALDKDASLHLAYTKIRAFTPELNEAGVSRWPENWAFDEQLQKRNQVPTANLMRRKTFMRLGGYRSRYCPAGAGSEDAHLWTMFGRHGYKCGLAAANAEFYYTIGAGQTSQKGYSEVDWLALIPEKHGAEPPFASYQKAKNISHPIHQYDEPVVSIIIPVGPGHIHYLPSLLDTIEAQIFKKWEVVVVNDSGEEIPSWIRIGYPYMRVYESNKRGAGAARNIGVKNARAKLIFFMDADDALMGNEALVKLVQVHNKEKTIVYTDYIGQVHTTNPDLLQSEVSTDKWRKWLGYDSKTKMAMIAHQAAEFDCEIAIRQPEPHRPYLWCNVSAIFPKEWHDQIGGFDEKMPSWEDWDYWIRMAMAGKCFTRISEELMIYRFHSGTRREVGLKSHPELFTYMIEKYKEVKKMGCGCKGKTSTAAVVSNQTTSDDVNYVLALYASANTGEHLVVGQGTTPKKNYGYRAGGDIFLVHKLDVAAQPHLFVCPENGARFSADFTC